MEHDQRQALSRGDRAREVLDNAAFQEALEAIKSEVIEQWASCPARDAEGKEMLWQLYKTTQKFENVLRGYIQTGKLAAEQLRRLEDKPKGLRSIFNRAAA